MAWPSDETKMDTGQLYVTTDGGETYHKVCEIKEIRTNDDAIDALAYINKEKENKTMGRHKPEARKCERCGKLFEVSINASYCDLKNAVNVINKAIEPTFYEKRNYKDEIIDKCRTETISIHNNDSDNKDESLIVLCPECRASLKQWWENPDKILVDATPCECEEAKSNG